MTSTHDPVLILSGAGLAPWAWDDVRADLTADSVVAPRPRHHSDASLRAYAEAAAAAAPAGKFAIVAHSSGGIVGAEVARLAPDRVSAFLAVTAVIPPSGGSFVSAMPAPNRWLLETAIRFGGTRPPATVIRRGLGAGLRDDVVQRIIDEFTPESKSLYLEKTAVRTWPGRRGFLVTTGDRELPPDLQRSFAQRLGADWVDEIDTGHLPMLQDAQATAHLIEKFLLAPDLPRTHPRSAGARSPGGLQADAGSGRPF